MLEAQELVISVDQANVEKQASKMGEAASYFVVSPLLSFEVDNDSTISANANSKEAHILAQVLLASLGEELDRETENIRELGADFEQSDTMIANLWASGANSPVFKEGN